MKRTIAVLLLLCSLLLAGCHSMSIGIIGGADGPTRIIVAERQ